MAEADPADDLTALPATMSDIFFSLVAVVVVVLLALTPALSVPGGLASRKADLATTPVLLDGQAAIVLTAEASGLRIRETAERFVPLDAILGDRALADLLRGRVQNTILVVAEDGQEAAFLVGSVAGAVGAGPLRLVRLDGACGHVADATRVACVPQVRGR